MEKIYECENSKKKELDKVLEADPYEQDSFARAGYKLKDGGMLELDKEKCYLYIKAGEDFFKKADEKLKEVAKVCNEEITKKVIEKIQEEEKNAASGIGDIFG